jgi:hypothetical protein
MVRYPCPRDSTPRNQPVPCGMGELNRKTVLALPRAAPQTGACAAASAGPASLNDLRLDERKLDAK